MQSLHGRSSRTCFWRGSICALSLAIHKTHQRHVALCAATYHHPPPLIPHSRIHQVENKSLAPFFSPISLCVFAFSFRAPRRLNEFEKCIHLARFAATHTEQQCMSVEFMADGLLVVHHHHHHSHCATLWSNAMRWATRKNHRPIAYIVI